MVEYRKPIKKGIEFGLNPLRWLPIFIVDLIFFTIAFGVIVSTGSLSSVTQTLMSGVPTTGAIAVLGWVALMGVAWFLVRLWVTGAVIHQTKKWKEFDKSWSVSASKYLSMLLAMIILIIIAMVVSFVPIVGGFLSIVVSVIFFFVMQSVIIKNNSASKALKDSYAIFNKSLSRAKIKDSVFILWAIVVVLLGLISLFMYSGQGGSQYALSVVSSWVMVSGILFFLFYSHMFRMWLAISVVSSIIVSIFSIPAIVTVVYSASPEVIALGGGNLINMMLLHFLSNVSALFVLGVIFLVGSSLATAFALKSQTEFYLQFKKKRFGLF